MRFQNEAFFNGIYIDGWPNGHGRILFSQDQNGEQYIGEWKDGIPGGGKGTYTDACGNKIEG